jgi:two-component system response regulator HydG
MLRLFEQLPAAAESERTVLICGESGVGKALLAEALHERSRRGAKPLLRLNCAEARCNGLESELFGHEKGAFAGAVRQKAGRVEQAGGGTLFLDEIDDLPPGVQARLLRLIDEQQIERLGGTTPFRVDARLICATKRDLLKLVQSGRFREDLYYRLNVITLSIPPLRERPEDIPVLAAHFIEKHASLANGRAVRLSPHALDELMRYSWPGNARELEHVLERALAFSAGPEIRPEHILPLARAVSVDGAALPVEADAGRLGLNESVADLERRLIGLALRQCNGNQARAAQRLGIPRTTLRDKMTKYGIPGG